MRKREQRYRIIGEIVVVIVIVIAIVVVVVVMVYNAPKNLSFRAINQTVAEYRPAPLLPPSPSNTTVLCSLIALVCCFFFFFSNRLNLPVCTSSDGKITSGLQKYICEWIFVFFFDFLQFNRGGFFLIFSFL